MAKNTEKFGKCEMHTGGSGILQENWKNVEKLETHNAGLEKWQKKKKKKQTRKNVENETQTVYELEYGEKQWKNVENEKCSL